MIFGSIFTSGMNTEGFDFFLNEELEPPNKGVFALGVFGLVCNAPNKLSIALVLETCSNPVSAVNGAFSSTGFGVNPDGAAVGFAFGNIAGAAAGVALAGFHVCGSGAVFCAVSSG